MRSPRFTVLIPTRDRDYCLKNAIQSILDQTFEDYEILIIDDGSRDKTEAMLKKMAHPKILYKKIPRQGIVPALLEGNSLARGEIIVKQDSDDISLPNRLEVIDAYFRMNPATDLFYHGMYQTYYADDGVLNRSYIPALPIEDRILKEQYIPGVFAYTKQFAEEVPYRKLYCSEDWMLILDAWLKKKWIGSLNVGLYEYFLRDDSNSMIHENTGHYEDDERIMKEILEKEYNITNFKYALRK